MIITRLSRRRGRHYALKNGGRQVSAPTAVFYLRPFLIYTAWTWFTIIFLPLRKRGRTVKSFFFYRACTRIGEFGFFTTVRPRVYCNSRSISTRRVHLLKRSTPRPVGRESTEFDAFPRSYLSKTERFRSFTFAGEHSCTRLPDNVHRRSLRYRVTKPPRRRIPPRIPNERVVVSVGFRAINYVTTGLGNLNRTLER